MRPQMEEIDLDQIAFDEVVTVEEDPSLKHLLVEKETDENGETVLKDGSPVIRRKIAGTGDLTPVVNKSRGKLVAMNGRNYKLLKNERFVELIRGVTGDTFRGTVKRDLKRMAVYYFPESQLGDNGELGQKSVHVNGDDEISLGLRFVNSYDASSSLKADFVGIRMICMNGITAKNLIDSKSMKHSKYKLNEENFKEYVETMYENAPLQELKTIFEEAKEDRIPTDVAIEWLVGFSEKYGLTNILLKWLLQEVDYDMAEVSKYELWNMVTRTLTHGHHKSSEGHLAKWNESTLEQKHEKANRVLLSAGDEQLDKKLVKAGKEKLCSSATMRIDGEKHVTTYGTKMYLQMQTVYGEAPEVMKERYYKEPEPLQGRDPEKVITPVDVQVVADK